MIFSFKPDDPKIIKMVYELANWAAHHIIHGRNGEAIYCAVISLDNMYAQTFADFLPDKEKPDASEIKQLYPRIFKGSVMYFLKMKESALQ